MSVALKNNDQPLSPSQRKANEALGKRSSLCPLKFRISLNAYFIPQNNMINTKPKKSRCQRSLSPLTERDSKSSQKIEKSWANPWVQNATSSSPMLCEVPIPPFRCKANSELSICQHKIVSECTTFPICIMCLPCKRVQLPEDWATKPQETSTFWKKNILSGK